MGRQIDGQLGLIGNVVKDHDLAALALADAAQDQQLGGAAERPQFLIMPDGGH